MNIGNLENEIQSWVAVRSFAVEDANPQAPIIDANELAEMLSRVFKKLDGCVVVPVEPTDAMLIAADNCVINGKVTAHNIYKAMLEAVKGIEERLTFTN